MFVYETPSLDYGIYRRIDFRGYENAHQETGTGYTVTTSQFPTLNVFVAMRMAVLFLAQSSHFGLLMCT